jgi:16S rRNA G966 N2-methylase RsmD
LDLTLLNPEIQKFIDANIENDISIIALQKNPFPKIIWIDILEQISGKQKAKTKLPTLFNTKNIIYPNKISVEQTSSEKTAKYKAELVTGNSLIDLTGGFGVDDYYFAQNINQVIHCEINEVLSEIVSHNLKQLHIENSECIAGESAEILKNLNQQFDWIYIDPSRRNQAIGKVFMLKDCEPDIISNLQLLRDHSSRILIKTAPLLDIQSAIKELKQVSRIHVVSIKNECKELLIIIDKEQETDDPLITCDLLGDDEKKYCFKLSEEKEFQIHQYSDPLEYIYEPDAALLKAGCFKLITRDFNIKKIHQHTHLYTSTELLDSFPGRTFILKKAGDYGTFIKENQVKKANIICRNFGLSPEEIKKKLKINDGGNEYLLFCTGPKNERMVLNCERIAK